MNERTRAGFDYREFLKTVTPRPGVYRFVDAGGDVLYVGKARNLKKRLASHFRSSGAPVKTLAWVEQTHHVEITVTNTETEALLLEDNLIKALRPRYNVLLRDDKSYPYIYLSDDQEVPRLSFYRGPRTGKGRYFGPYPSAAAVRESLNLLQKVFRIRQCEDSFFRNRSRPCLQYQIKRCTAPCVALVELAAYREDVHHAVMFLEGRSQDVIDDLVKRMEEAAMNFHYERAAHFRDQIASLRRVQERQYVSGEGGDLDVVAVAARNGIACVTVFFIRAGRNLGNKNFFPQHAEQSSTEEVLGAFLSQYYLSRDAPGEIIVNAEPPELDWLEAALTQHAGRKIAIAVRVRGARARWLDLAAANAEEALAARLAGNLSLLQRFEALQEALGLDTAPQRLECFDISHTQGEATVASCVVFDPAGPVKADYRRYNIEGIAAGDDYAAMRQVLTRRYTKLKEGEGKLPDVLFVDGGRGQLAQAEHVLEDLQLSDVTLVGIAKGPDRRPGLETLFLSGRNEPFILPANSPALHLVQHIRDEAHRFAVTGHRQRRARARNRSPLEDIPGLGPKRRRELLTRFGGLQGVARAGVQDLATVPGISADLAKRIYHVFHGDD